MVYTAHVWSFYSKMPNEYYARFIGDDILYIGCTRRYYMVPHADHIYTDQSGWILCRTKMTREQVLCALREKDASADLHVSRFHGVLKDEINNAKARHGVVYECGDRDTAAATEFCFSEQIAATGSVKSYVTISNPRMIL